MPMLNNSSYYSPSVRDSERENDYFEEIDTQQLDFRKRKTPPAPKRIVVPKPPPVVDPIQELNQKLNRQFRPDLAPPSPPPRTPSPPPIETPVPRTPSPDNVIFDARANIINSTLKTRRSTDIQKQSSNNQKVTSLKPSADTTIRKSENIPKSMMPTSYKSSQPNTVAMQNKLQSTINNTSFKNNKIGPPPPSFNSSQTNIPYPYNATSSIQSPTSTISSTQFLHSSHQSQQPMLKDKNNVKTKIQQDKKTTNSYSKYPDRSYALYNQEKGRVEGIVKNRLNIGTDEYGRVIDSDTAPKSELAIWFAQPLCCGLTRFSGGILFGSMILLAAGSVAGLIAASVLYSQDSVTDAQWKILGIVVCAIMLITIIITLIIILCCYKNGYMFTNDEDIDPNDSSTQYDADGNERQKAVLRKIYKFNRPNEQSSVASGAINEATSPAPIPPRTVQVSDAQTNTQQTIAVVRPKDFDRGFWPSKNLYGGISYRPLIQPKMTSRIIQVLPHEIEQAIQPQVIYKVVPTPIPVIQPPIQSRIIQVPIQPASVVEVVETPQKQPRTKLIRQPTTQQIVVQPRTHIQYVEVEDEFPQKIAKQPQYQIVEEMRPRHIIPQPQYEIVEEQIPRHIIPQPQYEIVEEQIPRHIIPQPQYEIVEEVDDDPVYSSSNQYVQVVQAPTYVHQGKKKERKQKQGGVSVKHVKSIID